jgi:hypothetical protein
MDHDDKGKDDMKCAGRTLRQCLIQHGTVWNTGVQYGTYTAMLQSIATLKANLTCFIETRYHAESVVREESFVVKCNAHQLSGSGRAHLAAVTVLVSNRRRRIK